MKNCNQCGKCCIHYADGGLSATPEEIEYWRTHRPDIARYVAGPDLWLDPETGKALTYCPWLKPADAKGRHGCSIYADRPGDCRYYPVSIAQMLADDCEMLEKRDLANPERAQARLDVLMADSRPPLK